MKKWKKGDLLALAAAVAWSVYSILMRIASLPLDIVKLDRAFVLMEEGGGHHVIIRNLIEMHSPIRNSTSPPIKNAIP